MDQVTQQNAALVEEAAAAAQSMQEQAGKLSQVVGTFKLDEGEAPSAPVMPVMPVQIRPAPEAAARAKPPVRRIAAASPPKPAAALPAGGDWESF
jgi:hypothetical protein